MCSPLTNENTLRGWLMTTDVTASYVILHEIMPTGGGEVIMPTDPHRGDGSGGHAMSMGTWQTVYILSLSQKLHTL